jgi:hypothetical protein
MGTGLDDCPPYILERSALMVSLYQLGTLKVLDRLPRIVAFRVPFPLDEVLQSLFPPLTSVAVDGLDFVLFFIPHEVWGRL